MRCTCATILLGMGLVMAQDLFLSKNTPLNADTSATCEDVPPNDGATCAQRLKWGGCSQNYMIGFCCQTCFGCDGSHGCPKPGPTPPPTPPPPTPASGSQPNILLILTDDQGFDDVGFRHWAKPGNARLLTPTIDQLANDSIQFEEFYVNPLCGPSRASLLTGRHHLEVGVWGVHGGTDFIDLSVPTFAQELQPLGYTTSFFGKWHSGKTDGYYPHHKGFNHAVMASLYHFWDNEFTVNGVPTPTQGWTEEVMVQYAMDYLDDWVSSATSNPFLMYYAPITCHEGIGPSDPGSAEHHAPADIIAAYSAKGFSAVMSRLYASIEFMDMQLGRLLGKLNALGLEESTVVIFSSDNGPNRDHNINEDDWLIRNPSRMEYSKSYIEENGIRQNLFVRWPGTYAPATIKGSVCSVTDILPTMVELAGGVVSPGQNSRSLVPLLEGRADSWFDTRNVYQYRSVEQFGTQTFAYVNGTVDKTREVFSFNEKLAAVRQGIYKLTRKPLYDLQASNHREINRTTNPGWQDVKTAMEAERLRWWQDDVLASPLSFAKPVVQVCYEGEPSSLFYSYMATEQSGLEVTNHEVDGWDAVGDSLTFRLQVHCGGNYELLYNVALKEDCAAVLTLTIAGATVTKEILPGTKSTRFPAISLEEGPTEMKIELANVSGIGSNVPSAFSESTLLFLQRV